MIPGQLWSTNRSGRGKTRSRTSWLHESYYKLDPGFQASLSGRTSEIARVHGSGGEWRVEKQRLRWEILDAFAQAAQQAGIQAIDDFNTATITVSATSM